MTSEKVDNSLLFMRINCYNWSFMTLLRGTR